MKGKVLKPPLPSVVLNSGSSMSLSSSATNGPSIIKTERKWRWKQVNSCVVNKKLDEQLVNIPNSDEETREIRRAGHDRFEIVPLP